MAFAGRAKVEEDAVVMLQKYVRRWIARRLVRALKFEMLMQRDGGSVPAHGEDIGLQETQYSHAATRCVIMRDVSPEHSVDIEHQESTPVGTEPHRECTGGTSHNRTVPRSASWHFGPDRSPLMVIEMQRKADRRSHLRKVSAERKENQPQHHTVAAPLTQQQQLKVARRNHPHSRQSTPTTDSERPQRPQSCENCPTYHQAVLMPNHPAGNADTCTQASAQRPGALLHTFGFSVKPQHLPHTMKVPAQVTPSTDQVWTAEAACKDHSNWLSVLNHERTYNQLQRVLTPGKSEHAAQQKPLLRTLEGLQQQKIARVEDMPEDPADIAHMMTQTQQGALLASVDSCFRMLAGRYKQLWALPNTHTVDERDWAYRQMLNKVQPLEGELYRPLNGRIIQTGEDVSAVIDELNRALTPSLEEFRARSAPVVTGQVQNILDKEHSSNPAAPTVCQATAEDRHTDTGSLGHLQADMGTIEPQVNCGQNRVVIGNAPVNVPEIGKESAQNSWDGSAGNPLHEDDEDGYVSESGTPEEAKQGVQDDSSIESLLCPIDTATEDVNQGLQQGSGPMHSAATAQAGSVHTADDMEEDALSLVSMRSDVSEAQIPVPAPEVTEYGMYRGEGTGDTNPGERRYENVRRGNNSRLLKAGGASRKGKPRFMRGLTRAPTFTTRVQKEQRELFKIADRDHMLAPCTPLKTSVAATSPRPRLKMTQSKVWTYWSASFQSSAVGIQQPTTLNLGRTGIPSDAGSLGPLFAEQSRCGTEVSDVCHKRSTTQHAQVRFQDHSAQLPTTKPARPRSESSMRWREPVEPPLSEAPPPLAPHPSNVTVSPIIDAESATEQMSAAAALIEARQRSLDTFNAQLYRIRKYQHQLEDVEWHETHQVPGDPWQPHQMHPTRVGIISRSFLPCATRAPQPASQPPAVKGVALYNDSRSAQQLPEREHSIVVRQIQPLRSRLPSLG